MPSALKAAMLPAATWVIIDVLLRIGSAVDPTVGLNFPTYQADPWTVALTLALALWAGAAIKQVKGKFYEAIIGGVLVGLGCGIPAFALFGGATGFVIAIVLFAAGTALAGWGLKEAIGTMATH